MRSYLFSLSVLLEIIRSPHFCFLQASMHAKEEATAPAWFMSASIRRSTSTGMCSWREWSPLTCWKSWIVTQSLKTSCSSWVWVSAEMVKGVQEKREEGLLAGDVLGIRVLGTSWGRGAFIWESLTTVSLFYREKQCFCCQRSDSQNTVFSWETAAEQPLAVSGPCWNRLLCPLHCHPGSIITSHMEADIFNTSTNSSLTGIGHLRKRRLFLSNLCQSLQTAKGVQAGFCGGMCLAVGLSEGGGLICFCPRKLPGQQESRVLLICLPLPVSMFSAS